MTTATHVAALFDNDGAQYWLDHAKETSIEDVCRQRGAAVTKHFDTTRYVFPDRSVITVQLCHWDFGHSECFCWQGGHSEDCPTERASRQSA